MDESFKSEVRSKTRSNWFGGPKNTFIEGKFRNKSKVIITFGVAYKFLGMPNYKFISSPENAVSEVLSPKPFLHFTSQGC